MKYKKTIIIIFIILLSILFSGCSQTAIVPVGTDDRGNLEVAIQDQFTEIIDLRMSQFIDNITLLDNYSKGDFYINVSSNTAPLFNDEVELNHNHRFYQAEILQVVSLGGNNYQLLLDKPLDDDFNASSPAQLVNTNFAILGSLSNPITFDVSPKDLQNISWDITRIIIACLGPGTTAPDPTPDLASFMTMDALTNGVIFRQVDGETVNIFNAKDNFHLVSEAYDLSLYPANRFGAYGAAVRRSFNGPDKNGVVIRLVSESEDTFEFIVRDDLTAMTDCHVVVQGHTVDR